MRLAYIIASLTFGLLAVEAKEPQVEYVTIHCYNSRVKKTSVVPPDVCREVCFAKANKCRRDTTEEYAHNRLKGIEVNFECFNEEDEHATDCIFPREGDTNLSLPVLSGIVVVKSYEETTVHFTKSKDVETDGNVFAGKGVPIVFAQTVHEHGYGIHDKVRIRHISETLFTFEVEGTPKAQYAVAWFAINDDPSLKNFEANHVHLEKLTFQKSHSLVIRNPADTYRSRNIAVFVQELSAHFDVGLKLNVTDQDVTVELSATGNTSNESDVLVLNADVGLLLVDMDYFKLGEQIYFGNMPVSFLVPQQQGDQIVIPVESETKPLMFHTGYYNRIDNIRPISACIWIEKDQSHGFFTCEFDPAPLLTLPPKGPPNVAFFMVKYIDVGIDEHREWFNYGACYQVHAMVEDHEEEPAETSDQANESVPVVKKENKSIHCKKLCVLRNRICRGDIECLHVYISPTCVIPRGETEKVKREVTAETHRYLEPFIILGEEMMGAVCPGLYTALTPEEVVKQRDRWLNAAKAACQETVGIAARKDFLVVVNGFVSKNFCETIVTKNTKATWISMKEFRSEYNKGGEDISLKGIFADYRVYGVCKYDEEIKFQAYKEPVNIEETDLSVAIDCIETEWEEWSACSGDCIPETGQVVRERVRSVLRAPVGKGRKCITEQTKPCTEQDLPLCSSTCILSEWSEWSRCIRSMRIRQRYVRSYTKHCDSMKMVEKEKCESIEYSSEEREYEEEADLDTPGTYENQEENSRWDSTPMSIEEYMNTLDNNGYYQDQEVSDYMPQDDYGEHNNFYTWNHDWPQETEGLYRDDAIEAAGEKQDRDAVIEEDNREMPSQIVTQSIPELPNEAVVPDTGSFLELKGNKTEENKPGVQSAIWSEWSGCSSVCNDEPGSRYKFSTIADPSTLYDICGDIEQETCEPNDDCGLAHTINCDGVRSAYYTEGTDEECRIQCNLLLEQCRLEHHRSDIECLTRLLDKTNDPSGFLFKCILPDESKERIELLRTMFKNKCFLTRAVYSDTKKSWVNEETQSCFCSIPGAIPCTSTEVHYSRNDIYSDLIESGFCPIDDYKSYFPVHENGSGRPDSLTYVSLAGNKRLHCPLALDNNDMFTYTEFGEEKLEHYCQYGPLYALKRSVMTPTVEQYEHKYNCDTAVSAGGLSDIECKFLCRTVRGTCLSKHEPYLKCIKDRLSTRDKYEGSLFQEYGCKLPHTLDASFNEHYYRAYVTTFETELMSKKACAILVHNAIMHCDVQDMLDNPDSMTRCMATAIGDVEVTQKITMGRLFPTVEGPAEKFRKQCTFNPALKAGSGYVMCRFPNERENYEMWSEWSACTADCNDFDDVATRYRTRKVAKHAENRFFLSGLGTLQFELCLHLGGCNKGRWIDSLNDEDNKIHILNYKAYIRDKHNEMAEWLEHTYNRYPELRSEASSGATCQIFRSVKTLSYKGVTCGCPKNHPPCSFATAISSPMWIEGVENFCKDRPLASIGFQGEISNYRYYCNIGMLLTPTEYSSTLACDYYDNNEYVACQSIDHEPITLRTKHFTFMGICLGLIFSVYAVLRKIVSRRRIKARAAEKED